MFHRGLQGRQASETMASSSSFSRPEQPTITIALSTTFTPPASCTLNRLTIQPPPFYNIWANDPVPVANTTFTDCYPSEFLQSYTSVSSASVGSSVVPVMSPLVCPQNFCVQFAREKYMACCPSGYKFTPPEDPLIASRPAYGGTCYSPFTMGVTETAVAYDEDGSTRLQPWAATTTGDNAYAHPIDGFAENTPSVGCIAPISTSLPSNSSSAETTSSLSSTATLSDTTTAAGNSSKTSSATIAGAVVGAVVGLGVIVGLIFFLLRRRKHQPRSSEPEIHQIDDTPNHKVEKDGKVILGEIDAGVPVAELAARPDKYAYVQGAHEMHAGVAHEMPAGPELHPSKDRTGPSEL
ncbi:hypothetical protein C7974DRAFT_192787 [Boeremia exigua]|uniref:uncharacterized protein n=1 Tax=Boeremia exigua TaxID=749465 RepID=UPI001E8D1C2B|nr:uncharacterized protein C7974DRAFT_192787 [Boeremia exigua]KAH6629755.1 hypothetical protein C7974DRAFT_192787 [Boeremia exigua]